ncbi:DUF1353 domain-containing protein [Leptospira mayottensis]|uniref:PF07087 domain protein n=2 Tax=Leptospira mayottensis TaxID=1137606 RepID=A0AA87MMS2_9LEPT|nr:DUF1353 domain-containing protein [Leptospira mayottensis]AXR59861.1 DUF1353 domain-containing protein [Leptospira mayottensis]AXR63890.1 DUF1353 domain-containing protein [Leptospira mayottensis]AZQ00814.1 DUF1353 domain-containing protein [Leptospira mayottensis 200901116]EKR99921.1 PF07087 domain protein [Leptospira mayottensis 200901122]TGN09066.1 DUF1353 domain-containing protein [Leptospira mayottensis]
MDHIVYKNLKNYKYQLVKPYSFQTTILTNTPIQIEIPRARVFVNLNQEGLLDINAGYAWDGPSGPTIDTKTFIRASLVHDALYQLMREEKLDRIKYREDADQLLKRICLEDGMNSFRAAYVYKFVRWFGKSSTKPKDKTKEWETAP